MYQSYLSHEFPKKAGKNSFFQTIGWCLWLLIDITDLTIDVENQTVYFISRMFEQETLGKDWSYLLIGVTPPKHAVAKDYKIGCFNYKTSKYEHEVAVLHYHDLTRNLALLTEAEDADKRILVTKTKGTIQFWSLASNFKAKSVQKIDKIDPQGIFH